jgi:secondary thiamine-phosphate synthase enzyme
MRSEEISLEMSGRHFADITSVVADFIVRESDGLVNVFVPHATAGLALMETGSGSDLDLERVLNELLPRDDRWKHRHGSPGHGADHVLPAFMSPSLVIPVVGGAMQLGTWQSVVFVDLNEDNPSRKVRLSFIGS